MIKGFKNSDLKLVAAIKLPALWVCRYAHVTALTNSALIQYLFILSGGMFLINSGLASIAAASPATPPSTQAIDEAICWLMYFQGGSYGALLEVVAGVGALVGAVMGSYRTAINCLVVGVGTWLIEPVAELFFGYWPANCARLTAVIPSGVTNP